MQLSPILPRRTLLVRSTSDLPAGSAGNCGSTDANGHPEALCDSHLEDPNGDVRLDKRRAAPPKKAPKTKLPGAHAEARAKQRQARDDEKLCRLQERSLRLLGSAADAADAAGIADATDLNNLSDRVDPQPHALHGHAGPGASSGRRRRLRSRTVCAALGSSQLRGCPGDFCDASAQLFSVVDLQGAQGEVAGKGAFRARLAESVERENEILKAELGAEARTSVARSLKEPSSASRVAAHEGRPLAEEEAGASPSRSIPMRSIVMARLEEHLVGLALRRRMANEEGDYVAQSTRAFLVEEEFPSKIYGNATVCTHCYSIYSFIEAERKRALRKLGRGSCKAARETAPAVGPPPAAGAPPRGLEAAERAMRQMRQMTKKDLAELRSFNKPPPAVSMAVAALCVTVHGEAPSWPEMRRLIGSDHFHALLRSFDAAAVPARVLRRVMGYVENPRFRPEIIRPISQAAANVCAFVLGVVRAGSWRDGSGHARRELLAPDGAGHTAGPPPPPTGDDAAFDVAVRPKSSPARRRADRKGRRGKRRQPRSRIPALASPLGGPQRASDGADCEARGATGGTAERGDGDPSLPVAEKRERGRRRQEVERGTTARARAVWPHDIRAPTDLRMPKVAGSVAAPEGEMEETLLVAAPAAGSAHTETQELNLAAGGDPSHEVAVHRAAAEEERRRGARGGEGAPRVPDLESLEASFAARREAFLTVSESRRARETEAAQDAVRKMQEDAEERRRAYAAEDERVMAKLHETLAKRRMQRPRAEKQRRTEADASGGELVQAILAHNLPRELAPARTAAPADRRESPLLPRRAREAVEGPDIAGREEAPGKTASAPRKRRRRDDALKRAERQRLLHRCASIAQRAWRGALGRARAKELRDRRRLERERARLAVMLQSAARRSLARRRVRARRKLVHRRTMATTIQACFRSHRARLAYAAKQPRGRARDVQRAHRGHRGRVAAGRARAAAADREQRRLSATKIQAARRMHVCRKAFFVTRARSTAAREVQRVCRGHFGRQRADRRRRWQKAEPGPERLKLGMAMIEESKRAFERQQEEIDDLRRAQEHAETRLSTIHVEMAASEKELHGLERELQEVDRIENDLQDLTLERQVLQRGTRGIANAAAVAPGDCGSSPRKGAPASWDAEGGALGDPGAAGDPKSTAAALDAAIHAKRAEREARRAQLEAEFATVLQQVHKKRKALGRLEASLSEMEATRERKDREFSRLQRSLMELLEEQRYELDALREKGVELETVTATSAAAAAATAQRAKEQERRSSAMFSQTEELMKFQFMSMSLSYFSSLSMLQQMRDINADATSAAVSSSAEVAAAASAAAAAAVASLPTRRDLDLGAAKVAGALSGDAQSEAGAAGTVEEELRGGIDQPLPDDVRTWTVEDVGRWLETLRLRQYKKAFAEACVDGDFLLELRTEDMSEVLGMAHKLHVRKVVVARERLKLRGEREAEQRTAARREPSADAGRGGRTAASGGGAPPLDAVFSQARNGRFKRVEESLNLGFPVNAEDEKGNTLLLVACQQTNQKLASLLLQRGAAVNHRNAAGNTPLHFALSYESSGALAEFLIERGADDTIANNAGLGPYDGLG